MKIKATSFGNKEGKTAWFRLFLVSMLVAIVISVLLICLIENHYSNNKNHDDYTSSMFGVKITNPTIDWPSSKGKRFVSLNTLHDNYLDISLSKNDKYKIEFINDSKNYNDYIIISSFSDTQEEFQSYLYLIPEYIALQGYDSVVVSPISGDGVYAVSYVSVITNPIFEDYVDSQIVDFEIKVMDIEIDEKSFDKLQAKRDEALAARILIANDDDYVPAEIRVNGEKYDTKLRLKGDWTDHLKSDKWSLRIKVDNDCIFGMEKLSIQPPETRRGIGEYLIQEFYAQQGGVALRYDFVDVVINGVYKGVYAVEEAFDKRVVEHSWQREGAIVRFDETTIWESRAYYYNNLPYSSIAQVKPFNFNKVMSDEKLYNYVTYAAHALNLARTELVEVEELFDIEKYALYCAVQDIFAAHHGVHWHNVRYYYNPITARIEPIIFDMIIGHSKELSYNYTRDRIIFSNMFSDEEFVDLYFDTLYRLADEVIVFLDNESYNIEKYDLILARDGYSAFSTNTIYKQIKKVEGIKHNQGVQIDLKIEGNNGIQLEISNRNILPVTIIDVMYKQQSIEYEIHTVSNSQIIITIEDANGIEEFEDLSIKYKLPNMDEEFIENNINNL